MLLYYLVIAGITDIRVSLMALPWRMFHLQAVRGKGSERAEYEVLCFTLILLATLIYKITIPKSQLGPPYVDISEVMKW